MRYARDAERDAERDEERDAERYAERYAESKFWVFDFYQGRDVYGGFWNMKKWLL